MTALLLLLLGGPAHAQYSEFTPEGANCGDPNPIQGTAGVRNATEAIQTNANTYSAANFANRQLNSLDADSYWEIGDDWRLGVATDINVTYGAADMVVYHPRHLQYPDECEDAWRVATKGLDLQAANTGLVFRKGAFGAFYATSFTWAAPAYGDQFTRVLMTSMVAPAYVLSASLLAGPLDLVTKGPLESTNEFSSVRLEWMAGATLERDRVHASAAYLSSGGGYFQASEELFGAYAFGTLQAPQDGVAETPLLSRSVFQVGLDRLDPDAAFGSLSRLGLLSMAYKKLPQQLTSGLRGPAPALQQLRVGKASLQNLSGVFDVNGRYRIEPSASLSELTVGVHTADFHAPRTGRDADSDFLALVQGGMVNTPAAWSEGSGAAQLWTLRGAIGGQYQDADIYFSIYLNDPDQLELYPFARNAVSYQIWVASAAL